MYENQVLPTKRFVFYFVSAHSADVKESRRKRGGLTYTLLLNNIIRLLLLKKKKLNFSKKNKLTK